MRAPLFIAWLKCQWRIRRAKTEAGYLLAELDYVNAELQSMNSIEDEPDFARMSYLFNRREYLISQPVEVEE